MLSKCLPVERMAQARCNLGKRTENERITQNVVARQAPRSIHAGADHEQVAIERPRCESTSPMTAIPGSLDRIEPSFDVVCTQLRFECDDDVQKIVTIETQRGTAIDRRDTQIAKGLAQGTDAANQLTLGLDIAADTHVHVYPHDTTRHRRPPDDSAVQT